MKNKIICGIISLGLIFQPVTLHPLKVYGASSTSVLKVGMKNQSVTSLQQKLKELGYFNGKVTGYYGSITKESVKRFQKNNNLTSDGIAGPATLSALNNTQSKSSVKSVTRGSRNGSALDSTWFGKIENALPRGGVFTVLDIHTGKSFQAKRTFGTNHADVETLTKQDTSIMKDIYGNQWSWERRPIIVEYSGLSIPASMTGMPHAGNDSSPSVAYTSWRSGGYGAGENLDDVKGNDMDGHFDIHFLGSKTHGSNKVDSGHQSAIQIAIDYLSK